MRDRIGGIGYGRGGKRGNTLSGSYFLRFLAKRIERICMDSETKKAS